MVYIKLDKTFFELNKELDFTNFTTPINDTAEKINFFKNYKSKVEYNPQYKYKYQKIDFDSLKQKIEKIKSKERIYQELKINFLKKIEFFSKLKNDENPGFLYGKPDEEINQKAQVLISKKKGSKQTRNISGKITKTIFQDYLKGFQLSNWKVSIRSRMSANIFVSPSEKKIYLKNRNFSFRDIRTLLSHEIETHVFRSANGYQQKYKVLGSVGTPSYLETEEGLATLMEDLNYNHNYVRFKFICARNIAAFESLNQSFYNVFKILKEKYNLSMNNSYLITKRIKRGLKDTSQPGGFIKDHLYFQGREKVIDYVNEGNDLKDLYGGKYGISDLKYLKKSLKEPKYLPYILKEKLPIQNIR